MYCLNIVIAQLLNVDRITKKNTHTALFLILKKCRFIEPNELNRTFRGQLLLKVKLLCAGLHRAGSSSALCISKDTNSTMCSQCLTTLMLKKVFVVVWIFLCVLLFVFLFFKIEFQFVFCLLPFNTCSEKSLDLSSAHPSRGGL